MFVLQLWSGQQGQSDNVLFDSSHWAELARQRELLYSAVRVENMRSAELWTGLACLPGREGGEHNSYTPPTSPNLSLSTLYYRTRE